MSDDLVKRLNARLGGVEAPEAMHGDNLSIVLCSFYEDAEGEVDDNGWTETATKNCEATLEAIRQHYAPLAARIEELVADFNRQVERTDEQRQAYEDRLNDMEAERDALAALLREAEEAARKARDVQRRLQADTYWRTPDNTLWPALTDSTERLDALLARLEARDA